MAFVRSVQKDKKGYLEADLRSLGIEPKKKNEPNDNEELQNLIDNIKDSMYQDYKDSLRCQRRPIQGRSKIYGRRLISYNHETIPISV